MDDNAEREDIEVPGRDRHEQGIPPPPPGRDVEERTLEAAEADQLDQVTPIRGGDEIGRIEPGDETDGGI